MGCALNDLEQHHTSAATWAGRGLRRFGDGRLGGRRRRRQDTVGKQLASPSDLPGALRVGEEPDVTDAMEPVREHVQQEPPHELGGRERHRAVTGWAGLTIILDLERHALAVERGDAPVGDGDAVNWRDN